MDVDRVPTRVFAGFPSPGLDWSEHELDIRALLCPAPEGTYFVTVQGNSMSGAGIEHHDLLIVDRTLGPEQHDIVVACLNGAFVVKRIAFIGDSIQLQSAHPAYPPVRVTAQMQFHVWGVVTFVIHPVHPLAASKLRQRRVERS